MLSQVQSITPIQGRRSAAKAKNTTMASTSRSRMAFAHATADAPAGTWLTT